jgi:hypothetical protein
MPAQPRFGFCLQAHAHHSISEQGASKQQLLTKKEPSDYVKVSIIIIIIITPLSY